jgi:hypothetical protein
MVLNRRGDYLDGTPILMRTEMASKSGLTKGVPGFHAVTRGRGGEGGSRGLKNIFYRGHILCILVHLEIELSHLE